MELQRLAKVLGRLPNKRDVEMLSKYALSVFEEVFRSWGAALKAAKIIASDLSHLEFEQEASRQLEIFENAQSQVAAPINDDSFSSSSVETTLRDEPEAFDNRIV